MSDAGWYPDPGTGRLRYFDGQTWGALAPEDVEPTGLSPTADAPSTSAPQSSPIDDEADGDQLSPATSASPRHDASRQGRVTPSPQKLAVLAGVAGVAIAAVVTATVLLTGGKPSNTSAPVTTSSALGSTPERPASTSASRTGPSTPAAIYDALLAGPFDASDLPSAVVGVRQRQYADSPPVGYFNGVQVSFATVQETAALSLKPQISFDVMQTPQYAQGATQEALANLKQYLPQSFVDESSIAPGAWCDTSQASCTALVGRVVVRVDAIPNTYGASNGLDVNVPLLTAGIRYARSAGA